MLDDVLHSSPSLKAERSASNFVNHTQILQVGYAMSTIKRLMENEDIRAKIYLVGWAATIAATISMVIGGVILIIVVLQGAGFI